MIKSIVGFILRILPRPFLQLISKPIFKFISIFYRGNNVECPICDSRFSKFFPYGRDSRDNALCTNCLSLERHRLLYIYLFEKSGSGSATDVRIGPGRTSVALRRRLVAAEQL